MKRTTERRTAKSSKKGRGLLVRYLDSHRNWDILIALASFGLLCVAASCAHVTTAVADNSAASTLFSAVAGVSGSLLGFFIAALTIVMGYTRDDVFRKAVRQGVYNTVLRCYMRAIWAFAMLTALSLLLVWTRSVVTVSAFGVIACWCVVCLTRAVLQLHLIMERVAPPKRQKQRHLKAYNLPAQTVPPPPSPPAPPATPPAPHP